MKNFLLSHEDFYINIPSTDDDQMMPADYKLSSSSSFSSNSTSLTLKDWLAHPKEYLWHLMSDDELMWRASMAPRVAEYPYNRTAKVAFMFLARGRLPLAPIWERFFKGHDERLFSIYLHCSPEFTEGPSASSVFYNRRIPSKQVEWGKASMIDAERRLLANALLDFSNERFVLLSESCIPLFNFTTIYNFLINSKYSFLSSFDDPRPIGRGRYNKRMWPVISLSDWRKGSQWFEVQRKVAIDLISDRKYYPVFREHCKPPCYMDEHYMATLVNKQNPELNSNRSITWVDWSNGGSHPKSFLRKDVSEAFLDRIRHEFINCTYNGNSTSSYCFVFARKFHPSTLEPLLRITPKLFGFDP
ncbi:Glycosyl transferase [Macleaya cordata]|uniref:Glycosyl transferase n=1 Tax=Macleaya cordata TaxID=56857 RepID=A0A200PMY9_MACCD|nr:Glycosyl transferase [Macleaya cordata]